MTYIASASKVTGGDSQPLARRSHTTDGSWCRRERERGGRTQTARAIDRDTSIQSPIWYSGTQKQQEKAMDFIERIFGLSPDGGSGAYEALLLFILFAGVALFVVWRRQRQRR